jgi:Tfp pilus assembly protein PilV
MNSDAWKRHQRGISMVGFLFVAAVLLIVALLAFRMIPSYIEFYTVQRALEDALTETNDPTQATVRRSVERKLNADYVEAVTAKDVQVAKSGNNITASASWEKKLPLVHNVSLVMEFNATASK